MIVRLGKDLDCLKKLFTFVLFFSGWQVESIHVITRKFSPSFVIVLVLSLQIQVSVAKLCILYDLVKSLSLNAKFKVLDF